MQNKWPGGVVLVAFLLRQDGEADICVYIIYMCACYFLLTSYIA